MFLSEANLPRVILPSDQQIAETMQRAIGFIPETMMLDGRLINTLRLFAENWVYGSYNLSIHRRLLWKKTVITRCNVIAYALKEANLQRFINNQLINDLDVALSTLSIFMHEDLDAILPMHTMDVIVVDREQDGSYVLTNYGDYRIIKFHQENPKWKPRQSTEEPEVLAIAAIYSRLKL
jgi:hypothetical protein